MTTIFEALRQSHQQQRQLGEELLKTSGNTPERKALFESYKNELFAHAVGEDRYFYIPLMMTDSGLNITRHALAEHHEIDELLAELTELDMSHSSWLKKAKTLVETVLHHLDEEEHGFFQQAGKILSEKEKTTLAKQYVNEYQKYKKSDQNALVE